MITARVCLLIRKLYGFKPQNIRELNLGEICPKIDNQVIAMLTRFFSIA